MQRAFIPAVALVCLVILTGAFFGKVLAANHQFALRDGGFFYYPLYQRVQHEWAAGRIPLWEMEENAGMPLLGNPSAAVLYPGKGVYGLLPYPWAARLYVVGHVFLAFVGQWSPPRSWGVSPAGAALAGWPMRSAGQWCSSIPTSSSWSARLGSMGFPRCGSAFAAGRALGDLGARSGAGDGDARRRPTDCVSDGGVRRGIRGGNVAMRWSGVAGMVKPGVVADFDWCGNRRDSLGDSGHGDLAYLMLGNRPGLAPATPPPRIPIEALSVAAWGMGGMAVVWHWWRRRNPGCWWLSAGTVRLGRLGCGPIRDATTSGLEFVLTACGRSPMGHTRFILSVWNRGGRSSGFGPISSGQCLTPGKTCWS